MRHRQWNTLWNNEWRSSVCRNKLMVLIFSGVHFAVAASSLGNQVTAGYTLVFAASLVCSM
jgi:hypothetical protein